MTTATTIATPSHGRVDHHQPVARRHADIDKKSRPTSISASAAAVPTNIPIATGPLVINARPNAVQRTAAIQKLRLPMYSAAMLISPITIHSSNSASVSASFEITMNNRLLLNTNVAHNARFSPAAFLTPHQTRPSVNSPEIVDGSRAANGVAPNTPIDAA